MAAVHCVACGTDSRPKEYHPSSLRAECTVWVVAIGIGIVGGGWSAVTSSSAPPGDRELQAYAMSTMSSADRGQDVEITATYNPPTVGMRLATWFREALVAFLRSAWWVLPVPLLFSLWRQLSTYEGCVHCGSRKLVPLPPELQ